MFATARRAPALRKFAVAAMLLLATTMTVLGSPKAALASTMGNGWTQPLPTSSGAADGFLADGCGIVNNYLSGYFHIGADYWGTGGSTGSGNDPVYSIGEGTVTTIGTGDFGDGTWVTMVHYTAPDNAGFTVVYGHLNNPGRLGVNTTVHAGTQLGTLSPTAPNGPHLHLGIHPDSSGSMPTSHWGNMPCPATWPPTNKNGFTDPMPYLDAHPLSGGSTQTSGWPSAVYNPSANEEQVYAIGTDGNVYLWWQPTPTSGFTGPATLTGASVQGSPSALYNPSSNTEQVYAVGGGNVYLWYQQSPTGGFTGPVVLSGASIQGSPSAVYNPAANTEQVYAVGSNGNVYFWYQPTPTGGFTGPVVLPGAGVAIQGSPAAVYNPSSNTEQVYAVGSDGKIYLWWQSTPTSGFTGPVALSGASVQGSPSAVYNPSSNTEQVYAIGSGNVYLWWQPTPTGGFTGPAAISGAAVQGSPSVVYNPAANTEQVYAVGSNNLYQWWQPTPTSGFTGPAAYSGPLQGSPSALYNPSSNTEQVYGISVNGAMYQYWQPSPTSGFTGPAAYVGPVSLD